MKIKIISRFITIIAFTTIFSANAAWGHAYEDKHITVELHNKFLNETFDFELSLFDNTKCLKLKKNEHQLDQETFKQVGIDLNNLRNDIVQCKQAPQYAKFYLQEYIKLEKHYANQNSILNSYINNTFENNEVEQLDQFVPQFWSKLSSASMTLHKVRLSLDVLNDADIKAYPECLKLAEKRHINKKHCKPICKLSIEKRLKYLEALKSLKPLVRQYWKESWCQALLETNRLQQIKKHQVFKVVNQNGELNDYFYQGSKASLYQGRAETPKENKNKIIAKPIATITMPSILGAKKKIDYYDFTRESYHDRLRLLNQDQENKGKSLWEKISEGYYRGFYPNFIRDNSKDLYAPEDLPSNQESLKP
jgi:hypothetical protein